MPWAVFTISLILSIVFEVVVGNYGGLVPCLAICAFYFTMRYGAMRTLAGVVVAAAFLDACWMHRFPSQVLMILTVTGLSNAWKPYGDVNSGLSLLLSGGCIGIVSWLFFLLGLLIAGNLEKSFYLIMQILVYQVVICIFLTPAVAFALNRLLRRSVTWLSAPDEDNE